VTQAERKILLIEDDADLRQALARQFALHEEFKVEQAETAIEGIAKSESTRPDLIILDVELPDMDGRDACKLIRKHKVSVPILMLTGQTSDADAILGLDSGANDYVAKPIKFPVLLARVRAHIRTHEQSDEVSFRFGPYEFKPAAKLLTDENERKIRLTEKETDILRYLYRASGRTVPRDELLKEVWGYNAQVTTHTLETHMYRLRQKVEPNPGVSRYLITEANGYSLQL
jgi:DNA-binding response OmpR family regulator